MALDTVVALRGATDGAVKVQDYEWRRASTASTLAHAAHDVAAYPGVSAGFSATVSALTVTVAPGAAVVSPSSSVAGSYLVSAGSSTAVTLAARDATYSRIDRVVQRVYDGRVDGSGLYTAALEVVTGTPAAVPVAAPADWLAGPTRPSAEVARAAS